MSYRNHYMCSGEWILKYAEQIIEKKYFWFSNKIWRQLYKWRDVECVAYSTNVLPVINNVKYIKDVCTNGEVCSDCPELVKSWQNGE